MYYDHIIRESPKPDEYPKHIHNEYEFLYFRRGNASLFINASVYKMNKRDLLFIPAGAYHYLLPSASSDAYERYCIHFSKKLLPKRFQEILQTLSNIYHIKKNSPIDLFFSSLARFEYDDKYEDADITFFIEQNLALLLTHLKYQQPNASIIPTETNNILNNILDYIDENLTQPITAELLSKIFYKSESWITHNFAKKLQIPLKKYINYKKIIYAQELIEAGKQPTTVAEELSFENYVTFYRAYLRFLNKKPNEDTPTSSAVKQ